jgi:hypothetical protein
MSDSCKCTFTYSCCLADCRSQRLSCEQLIGADETNPSRGPRPPESEKNGRAVLYCTYL